MQEYYRGQYDQSAVTEARAKKWVIGSIVSGVVTIVVVIVGTIVIQGVVYGLVFTSNHR